MAEKSTTEKAPAQKAAAPKAVAKTAVVKKEAVKSDDFAVIQTGGKQYIVSVGDVLDIELLAGEVKEGDKIVFDQVLMRDDGKAATIGDPVIKGGKVTATYVSDTKGKKLSIIRYKAKSNRDRKIGHRQKYATVKIEALV